jgi:hypothetical protein
LPFRAVRRFAAALACLDSAACDAVERGSRFNAFKTARERFAEVFDGLPL